MSDLVGNTNCCFSHAKAHLLSDAHLEVCQSKGNVLYLCFITALEKKCPICLGLFDEEDEVKKLPCSHRFHSTCIVPWLQRVCTVKFLNPYMTNGFSHRYHLGKTIFIFRGFRSGFEYLFSFF